MTVTVGAQPYGLAFDGRNISVANNDDDTVSVVLASTGTVLGTIPVGDRPQGPVFDGASVWVVNHGSDSLTKLTLLKQPLLWLPVALNE